MILNFDPLIFTRDFKVMSSGVQDRQTENKISNALTRLIIGTAHPNPWDWQHAPAPPSDHSNVTLDQRQSGMEPAFQDSGLMTRK